MATNPAHTNRLAKEASPYLLQHAHNPVDWYPWSDEAFRRAEAENKPVLVSIGYSSCHWCHVMERESFEDEAVAAFMNEHFINVKVDREERPDVDHMYMDAVQAISGSGGWPLNVFVTPGRKPFYGGTYYPPQPAFNRASWMQVLQAMSSAWKDRREDVEAQAGQLTAHLGKANDVLLSAGDEGEDLLVEANIHAAFASLMKGADMQWGGFGRAPKFPQTIALQFLLHYSQVYKHQGALDHALHTLTAMARGGLNDHLGGGFARYSTDAEWQVPHFEKMLYDNALLAMVYTEAGQITGEKYYREVAASILYFLEAEMMHPQGGFYSALDADSEGEEGKYYVWDFEAVEKLLGADMPLFAAYYNLAPEGNWEGTNVLWVTRPPEAFAAERGISVSELEKVLQKARARLLEERAHRPRPLLDNKVLLSWNALANLAFTRAYAATGELHYRGVAEKNMEFLLDVFRGGTGELLHTWKEGAARQPAFLDDHAFLIAALLELAQATARYELLDEAARLAEVVLKNFAVLDDPLFSFAARHLQEVPVQKKEVYDGATPSGNAVMARNLHHLSILFDRSEWRERSVQMVRAMGEAIVKYPTSFGQWLLLLFEQVRGTREVAILGREWENYLQKVLSVHISHKLVLASEKPQDKYPLLANKDVRAEILIYVCQNYVCRNPISTIDDFTGML